jgi:hypothetical protein
LAVPIAITAAARRTIARSQRRFSQRRAPVAQSSKKFASPITANGAPSAMAQSSAPTCGASV